MVYKNIGKKIILPVVRQCSAREFWIHKTLGHETTATKESTRLATSAIFGNKRPNNVNAPTSHFISSLTKTMWTQVNDLIMRCYVIDATTDPNRVLAFYSCCIVRILHRTLTKLPLRHRKRWRYNKNEANDTPEKKLQSIWCLPLRCGILPASHRPILRFPAENPEHSLRSEYHWFAYLSLRHWRCRSFLGRFCCSSRPEWWFPSLICRSGWHTIESHNERHRVAHSIVCISLPATDHKNERLTRIKYTARESITLW